jgi:hypothetical protein
MSEARPVPSPIACIAVLALAAFAFNWHWEMLQMPAYAEMAGRPWRATLTTCTWAALGDVGTTLAIFGVGALAARKLRWGIPGRWNVYLAAGLMAGACAIAIEWRALALGRWSYTEQMPIVPVLDVGLWPLLQLTLLVPGAMAMVAWWAARRASRKAPQRQCSINAESHLKF